MIFWLSFNKCRYLPILLVLYLSYGQIGLAQEATGLLDGRVFQGKIGPRQKPDLEDKLIFNNGRFWSEICTQCGFAPGHYWTRKEGNSIHFRGELVGDRGVFEYDGVVRGDHVQVSIRWTKERWYWTIERELGFQGELLVNVAAPDVSFSASIAANADPDQLAICNR